MKSDALVFFGATGDLASKKIFPALQAMVKRGHLDVPVIGVAKAGRGMGIDTARGLAVYLANSPPHSRRIRQVADALL